MARLKRIGGNQMTKVECRCGATELEISANPIVQFFCHCDDCQAASGGAYVPISLYPIPAVRVTEGTPKVWKLKTMPRSSCPECGTRLFAEPPGAGLRGVVGGLLPAGSFQPAFHIHCRYAVRPVRDELPHYEALPAGFGGSDVTVDW
jgi:hypothetical protein